VIASAQTRAAALDFGRHDEIAWLAALARSYWHSAELAAERGDTHTLILHCKQIACITREVFTLARTLGEAEVR
jgi:hypothetical protein